MVCVRAELLHRKISGLLYLCMITLTYWKHRCKAPTFAAFERPATRKYDLLRRVQALHDTYLRKLQSEGEKRDSRTANKCWIIQAFWTKHENFGLLPDTTMASLGPLVSKKTIVCEGKIVQNPFWFCGRLNLFVIANGGLCHVTNGATPPHKFNR